MDKINTSIGVIAIAALAAAGTALIKGQGTDTTKLVSATVSSDDAEVTDILKASPEVKPVTCDKEWAIIDGQHLVAWICSDVGYDPKRQSVLDKRAGSDGVKVQYTPNEKDGSISVDIKVLTGEVAPEVIPKPDPIPEPPAENPGDIGGGLKDNKIP